MSNTVASTQTFSLSKLTKPGKRACQHQYNSYYNYVLFKKILHI